MQFTVPKAQAREGFPEGPQGQRYKVGGGVTMGSLQGEGQVQSVEACQRMRKNKQRSQRGVSWGRWGAHMHLNLPQMLLTFSVLRGQR